MEVDKIKIQCTPNFMMIHNKSNKYLQNWLFFSKNKELDGGKGILLVLQLNHLCIKMVKLTI